MDYIQMLNTLQSMDYRQKNYDMEQQKQQLLMQKYQQEEEVRNRALLQQGQMDRGVNLARGSMASDLMGNAPDGYFQQGDPNDINTVLQEGMKDVNPASVSEQLAQGMFAAGAPFDAQKDAINLYSNMNGVGVNQSDTAQYVGYLKKAYKDAYKKEMPASEVAQKMVEWKRAQMAEVYGNTSAKKQAEYENDPRIAKAVAEAEAAVKIATGGAVAEAAGTGGKTPEYNWDLYKTVENSQESLTKVDMLIAELESVDDIQAHTGLGANLFNTLSKIQAMLGSRKAAGEVFKTEYLDALMGSEVFPLIKELGIGARGLDTPAEREFLRKVMTGDIVLNKQTLLKMARDRKTATLRNIEKYNQKVESGALDTFFQVTNIPKRKIEINKDYSNMSVQELLNEF
jgi:hypothetical protein